MSIQPGDKVEVQDRTGIADWCIDGEQYYVLISNDNLLMLEDTDGFSSFNIPRDQVKKVKEDISHQLLSELYECSDSAKFYIYDTDVDEAISFVSKLGNLVYHEKDNVKWYSANDGKITTTAFLKGED